MRDSLQPSPDRDQETGRIPFSQQAWTLDTLKVYLDSRFEDIRRYFADLMQVQEQTNRDRFTNAEKNVSTAFLAADKAVNAAMAASEKAVLKAENAAEKRAEASNEIRGAMVDAQAHFADKAETDRRLKLLEDKDLASQSKSVGVGQLWATAAAVVFAVAALLAIIFKFSPGG